MDVALATSAALPQLHHDDRILLELLRSEGVDARAVVWDDPKVDWASCRLCVVRSVWDYVWKPDEFIAWADHVDSVSTLRNSARVIRWNANKRYLGDLIARGVNTVPGKWFQKGARSDLEALMDAECWDEVVIKPAIASTGYGLMRVDRTTAVEGQQHVARLAEEGDYVIQVFLEEVLETGELSVVFIDGEYTHAVRKRGADGEIKVHEEFGGTDELADPTESEMELSRRAVAAVSEQTLYARVDLLSRGDERFVSELEVIEPELFLRHCDAAARLLADRIVKCVGGQVV